MSDKKRASKEQQSEERKAKSKNDRELIASSRLGFLVIFTCVVIVVVALMFTNMFDRSDRPQPTFVPADSVKASALSTSWACPISGGEKDGDSIILANPQKTESANVQISIFDAAGKKIRSEALTIKPNSFLTQNANVLGSTSSTTVFIDSFSAPIAVFRSLNLSDGEELTGCVNDLDAKASFPNLTTVRNSNSMIVLSNPFDEAVVVDVLATLTNISETQSIPVLDDLKGQIIPAKGRLNLDLQNLFGRFDVASVDVTSRSGFFASEALITFAGAQNSTGQTIIPAARDLATKNQLSWTGINPTRIIAKNGSTNTHSLNFKVLAIDNRSVSPEPILISPGTTSVLENLGADFGIRSATLSVEEGKKKPKNIFAAWIHASENSVSSGSQEGQNSKRHLVPVTVSDRLNLYNGGKKDVTVTYSLLGSQKVQRMNIKSGTFKIVELSELAISSASILLVESNHPIVVSSSNDTSTRYAPAVEVLP